MSNDKKSDEKGEFLGDFKAKVFELRGKDAADLMKSLGLEPSQPARKQKKLNRQEMVLAFGNFLDENIGQFSSDMEHAGASPKDIFEALQVAVAHNLGQVERGLSFINDAVLGKEEVTNEKYKVSVRVTSREQTDIGWAHRDFHLRNPDGKCVDPFKVGELDEDSPAAS